MGGVLYHANCIPIPQCRDIARQRIHPGRYGYGNANPAGFCTGIHPDSVGNDHDRDPDCPMDLKAHSADDKRHPENVTWRFQRKGKNYGRQRDCGNGQNIQPNERAVGQCRESKERLYRQCLSRTENAAILHQDSCGIFAVSGKCAGRNVQGVFDGYQR